MASLKKVPGSVVYPVKVTVYGSHDLKEISKKKGFCEWLQSYISFANSKRFGLIKESQDPNKTRAESEEIYKNYEYYNKLINRLRDLYNTLGNDLDMSEEDREIDSSFNGINMGKSQKYIEGLINHARASFVDYMFVKFRRPDKSKVNLADAKAVKEYQQEKEHYDHMVFEAKERYYERAGLVNQLIAEHYKMAKEMGMNKTQVAFSVDALPFEIDYEKEAKFLKNNIVKGEKQLYDALYEKYQQLLQERETNPDFDRSRLKKAEELMELQKNNLLELKNSKKNYENILANEEMRR